MRIEGRASRVETTTNEIATTVKQNAQSQAAFMGQAREARRSQAEQLVAIRGGVEVEASSCEVLEQRNVLLELRRKLEM